MKKQLKHLIAAPLTGYNPDGSVNKDVIPRYAEMLHANGVTGVFINGTTGEGLSLTVNERMTISKAWVESVPDGFEVIVHVGHTSQSTSRNLAIHAAEIGADAIGEIGPVFYKPDTVEALVEYTAETALAVPDMPYYYFHMPSRNNVLFPMIEFLQLAESAIPNLKGIKYTHNDITDYKKCVEFRSGKYNIHFSRDELFLEGLKAGATGAVGSTFSIIAPLFHKMAGSFFSGDSDEAVRLQFHLEKTVRYLYKTGGYSSALKAVMRIIGIELGGMRRPQVNISAAAVRKLESSLQEAGVISYLNKL
jgi:N-acetylneuraminate lyase